MCMSWAGQAGRKSLTAAPSGDCNTLAVHQDCCGEGNFPGEACKTKPCHCLWLDLKDRTWALGLELLKFLSKNTWAELEIALLQVQ